MSEPEWTWRQWAFVGTVLINEDRCPPATPKGYAEAMVLWRAEGRGEPPGTSDDPAIWVARGRVIKRAPFIPPQPSEAGMAWAYGGKFDERGFVALPGAQTSHIRIDHLDGKGCQWDPVSLGTWGAKDGENSA